MSVRNDKLDQNKIKIQAKDWDKIPPSQNLYFRN